MPIGVVWGMNRDFSSIAEPDNFFSFCKVLNATTLKNVLREARMVHFKADSVICRQGGPSDTFFVVNEGGAEVVIAGKHGAEPTVSSRVEEGGFFNRPHTVGAGN